MKYLYLLLTALLVSMTSCQKSLEEQAAEEAEEYTSRECPREVADKVISDSLVFERDTRTLIYYYSLQEPIDNKELLEQHLDEYNRQMSISISTSASLRKFVEAGFKFRYIYRSEKTKEVLLDLKF